MTTDAGAATDVYVCPDFASLVSPAAVAQSPRAQPAFESMVLQGDRQRFIVDDQSYARAIAEYEQLGGALGDAGRTGYVDEWSTSLTITFDSEGSIAIDAGTYRAWDCLNATFRGTPTSFSFGSDFSVTYVSFEPRLSLPRLVTLYEALPHVAKVEFSGNGVAATCGSAADSCLSIDGTRWTWVAYTEGPRCEHLWARSVTEADGGATIERWPEDGGTPWSWVDSAGCHERLWRTAGRDSGI